jgi:hypothetical protein
LAESGFNTYDERIRLLVENSSIALFQIEKCDCWPLHQKPGYESPALHFVVDAMTLSTDHKCPGIAQVREEIDRSDIRELQPVLLHIAQRYLLTLRRLFLRKLRKYCHILDSAIETTVLYYLQRREIKASQVSSLRWLTEGSI